MTEELKPKKLRGAAGFSPETRARVSALGGAAIAKRGPEYFRELGRKGGKAVFAKRGREHFVELGRKGGSS